MKYLKEESRRNVSLIFLIWFSTGTSSNVYVYSNCTTAGSAMDVHCKENQFYNRHNALRKFRDHHQNQHKKTHLTIGVLFFDFFLINC